VGGITHVRSNPFSIDAKPPPKKISSLNKQLIITTPMADTVLPTTLKKRRTGRYEYDTPKKAELFRAVVKSEDRPLKHVYEAENINERTARRWRKA